MTEPNTPPYNVHGRRARLLVVDDQPGNVRLMLAMFGDEHEVLVATDGEQALRLCCDMLPDLLLLDVQMPGLNGLDVCRQLKLRPETRAIPVIFVTGDEGTEAEMACWDAGGVDFVVKPVNAVTLHNRVRTHLALKFQADAFREMAYMDGLTGVANRRHFDQRLVAVWQGAVREQTPLGLIMMDVDHFKRYNDHYGHQAGDDCLRAIASSLRQHLKRPHDLLARYGGEEFVCLLPDTDLIGTILVAHKLCAAVRALTIPHLPAGGAGIATISAGAANGLPHLLAGPDMLLRQADNELYHAKQQGRDRVAFAAQTMPCHDFTFKQHFHDGSHSIDC